MAASVGIGNFDKNGTTNNSPTDCSVAIFFSPFLRLEAVETFIEDVTRVPYICNRLETGYN